MQSEKIYEYSLSTGLLDGKRRLRLAPDYIEYENKLSKSDSFTRIRKEDIVDIKHEMEFIIWYRFYVGCDFKIDIKTRDEGILKIAFRSYFSNNKDYTNTYAAIVDVVWNYYLSEIVDQWKAKFHKGHHFEMNGIMVVEQGVYLLKTKYLITWKDVAVKEYENYYTVYEREQPENNKLFRYNEWGSEILFSLIKILSKAEKS